MLGSLRASVQTRPPRCAVDRLNNPLKFPHQFLIKKNTRRSSYPLVAPIRSSLLSARLLLPRSNTWPLDWRPCLPGVVRDRLRAATRCSATELPALPARRGAQPPLSPSCPLPPYHRPATSGELHTLTSLHSPKQQGDVAMC